MNILDKFFSLFSHDIGIDLGTANTLVWVRGKGVVIREPSVVAMHKKTKKIIAIGTEAKKMLGKTPANIITIRPLRSGVISDFDATRAMIAHYIESVHDVGRFSAVWARPKVVIGIPSAVTEVQRRAVWEAALDAGARDAYLIEEPMAGAIGEGVSVFSPNGVMIVDIGGGTTEIAVISLGGIVVSRSLRVAGDEMDQAILHYIRLKHGLILGDATAEDVKIKIGSAYKKSSKSKIKNSKLSTEEISENQPKTRRESEEEQMAIVRGRDIESGLPKSLRVSESEIREALSPVLTQ
ncbi:MAG: rod shape-determining protein, partial [Patescibacteria group bacterium]